MNAFATPFIDAQTGAEIRAPFDLGPRVWYSWAVSSAVEHYVDIVGVTGSIPVPPTMNSPSRRLLRGTRNLGAGPRRERVETQDEGQKFPAFAEEPASGLPYRAPQRPRLRDQQNTASVQSPSRLRHCFIMKTPLPYGNGVFYFRITFQSHQPIPQAGNGLCHAPPDHLRA